ncbi:MAG: efflux RND transporter permease subunit [Phycisphaerae bacterium]
MERVYEWGLRQPKLVIGTALAVVLLMMPGLVFLRIQTDGNALVPQDAAAVQYDRQVRASFGLSDPLAVVIRSDHPSGIFNAATLELVKSLTADLSELDGVAAHDVSSLATEHSHRVEEGTLHFRRFLDPLPQSVSQLETLRSDLRTIQLYEGTLVSKDEQATTVLIGTPESRDRATFFADVRAVVDSTVARMGSTEQVDVIGAPAAEALLGHHLLADLGVPEGLLPGAIPASDDLSDARGLVFLTGWLTASFGLVPMAIGCMALIFLFFFRTVPAVVLPLMEVGAAIVFVFGLMGYTGIPLYLTIAVLPVILTAIGIADEIHIYAYFRQSLEVDDGASTTNVIRRTMAAMTKPVMQTSITTAVGFLSFSLSPLGPVRAFGLLTAVGVLFCMCWSLTVVPAMLSVMPRRWHARMWRMPGSASSASVGRMGPALVWLTRGCIRARVVVLVTTFALLVFAPAAVRRVCVQDSWINGFAPHSEFYRATTAFNDHFLGVHTLLLVLETDCHELRGDITIEDTGSHELMLPGDLIDDESQLVGRQLTFRIPFPKARRLRDGRMMEAQERVTWIERAKRQDGKIIVTLPKQVGSPTVAMRVLNAKTLSYRIADRQFLLPETIREVEHLTTFLRSMDHLSVGGALGPAEYVRTTNLMSRGLKPDARVIPDESERVLWLWEQYGRIRGLERRDQLINADYSTAIVSVFLKDANFQDTAQLMSEIDAYAARHLAPRGIRHRYAGDVAVSQTLIDAIVTTQIQSLLISLLGVTLVASLLGRSLLFGLLAVAPCALAVLFNFSLMGMTGIPLGVATSMFAGMTLGIGVDFAVHTLTRFRRAREEGHGVQDAILDAVQATGPAILVDAIAVALGFGLLTFSQVPANARLGALVVFSLIGCVSVTLVLLPVLLSVLRGRIRSADPSHLVNAGPSCA